MTADFRPVFVGGYIRSGTTLLRTLLDRHPQLAVANETYFMTRVAGGRLFRHQDHASLLQRWWAEPMCAGQALDEIALRRRFEAYPADSAHLFRAALEQYSSQREKSRCGEKTPGSDYDRQPRVLFRWFPLSKLVVTVRDPRAVYASILNVPFGHKNPVSQGVRWAYASRETRRLAEEFPERVRIVLFEELIHDPWLQLQRLMPWLGLDADRVQLDPSVETQAFNASQVPHMALASQPVNAERGDAWRKDLDPATAERVALAAGREMRHWGYQREFGCLSWVGRMSCGLDRILQSVVLHPRVRPLFRNLNRIGHLAGLRLDPWSRAQKPRQGRA